MKLSVSLLYRWEAQTMGSYNYFVGNNQGKTIQIKNKTYHQINYLVVHNVNKYWKFYTKIKLIFITYWMGALHFFIFTFR